MQYVHLFSHFSISVDSFGGAAHRYHSFLQIPFLIFILPPANHHHIRAWSDTQACQAIPSCFRVWIFGLLAPRRYSPAVPSFWAFCLRTTKSITTRLRNQATFDSSGPGFSSLRLSLLMSSGWKEKTTAAVQIQILDGKSNASLQLVRLEISLMDRGPHPKVLQIVKWQTYEHQTNIHAYFNTYIYIYIYTLKAPTVGSESLWSLSTFFNLLGTMGLHSKSTHSLVVSHYYI